MLMSCCVSIIIAGGGFWTCTGGTFDTGDFDFEKCLTIPSDDDLTGPSPTGPTGPTVPTGPTAPTAPSGGGGILCADSGSLYFDETKTCFSSKSKLIAVRWSWADSADAWECKGKVNRYFIELSSSNDNHTNKYSTIVYSKDSNSLIIDFSGAETIFNQQNIKFFITPMNSGGEKLATTPIMTIVDTGSAGMDEDSCEAVGGNPLNFLRSFTNTSVTPPPVVNTSCDSIGYWADDSACGSVACGTQPTKWLKWKIRGVIPRPYPSDCPQPDTRKLDETTCPIQACDNTNPSCPSYQYNKSQDPVPRDDPSYYFFQADNAYAVASSSSVNTLDECKQQCNCDPKCKTFWYDTNATGPTVTKCRLLDTNEVASKRKIDGEWEWDTLNDPTEYQSFFRKIDI